MVAQARMTSERLPGKVLLELGVGKTTLELVVERLRRVERAGMIAIATSVDSSDDPIAEMCERLEIGCHRGPLADVAGRYLEAADRFELDAFVRVTADSPLIDQALIDRGIALFGVGGADLVTNVFPSTFASGHSLEVLDTSVFRRAYGRMSEPDHFEHVTRYFYERPDEFRIRNFELGDGRDEGRIDVSIDTPDDAKLISAIIARMDRPHWEYGYDEVMRLYREVVG